MVKLHVRVGSELDELYFQSVFSAEDAMHLIREGEKLKHSGYEFYQMAMVDHNLKFVWSMPLDHGNISYASLKIPLSIVRALSGVEW